MARRKNFRTEARRLAGLKERAKTKARSLILKRGVATMAGAVGGALTAAAIVKSGVKPTTAAAMVTTAGIVGMATLDDIPRDIAVGIGAVGAGQLSLVLLTRSEIQSELASEPRNALDGTSLWHEDINPFLESAAPDSDVDVDIADEFRNARDSYAQDAYTAEHPSIYNEDDRGPVLEVA